MHGNARVDFCLFVYWKQPSVRRISGQYSSLQAALLVLEIYYVGEFFLIGTGPILLFKYMYALFFSTIMVGVGIFTLGGEF